LESTARYCSQCGAATFAAAGGPAGIPSRLVRPAAEQKLAGVCAGCARYFGIDVTIVRILWLVFALWPPFLGVLVYLICWIVMPLEAAVPAREVPEASAEPKTV
jgi:phage shock protein C